jgi:hypothetical protein
MKREVAYHWRDRAKKVRALADDMPDPHSKRMLVEIAARYDRLAERARELADEADD